MRNVDQTSDRAILLMFANGSNSELLSKTAITPMPPTSRPMSVVSIPRPRLGNTPTRRPLTLGVSRSAGRAAGQSPRPQLNVNGYQSQYLMAKSESPSRVSTTSRVLEGLESTTVTRLVRLARTTTITSGTRTVLFRSSQRKTLSTMQ